MTVFFIGIEKNIIVNINFYVKINIFNNSANVNKICLQLNFYLIAFITNYEMVFKV